MGSAECGLHKTGHQEWCPGGDLLLFSIFWIFCVLSHLFCFPPFFFMPLFLLLSTEQSCAWGTVNPWLTHCGAGTGFWTGSKTQRPHQLMLRVSWGPPAEASPLFCGQGWLPSNSALCSFHNCSSASPHLLASFRPVREVHFYPMLTWLNNVMKRGPVKSSAWFSLDTPGRWGLWVESTELSNLTVQPQTLWSWAKAKVVDKPSPREWKTPLGTCGVQNSILSPFPCHSQAGKLSISNPDLYYLSSRMHECITGSLVKEKTLHYQVQLPC